MGEKQARDRAIAREVIKSYTYVVIWMSISIAVILFNKWLLAYSGFPYPIALTMWHMAFCSTIAFVAVRVLGVVKSHNMAPREYCKRVMPIGAWRLSLCRGRCTTCPLLNASRLLGALAPMYQPLVCCCSGRRGRRPPAHAPSLSCLGPRCSNPPLPFPSSPVPLIPPPPGLLYAGSLWLSNSSYLYLSVSFIQMTKSLMPGLVYAAGCCVGTERFRGRVALIMALIAFGVVVCAMGEVNLVVKGLVQQLTALGFEVGAWGGAWVHVGGCVDACAGGMRGWMRRCSPEGS